MYVDHHTASWLLDSSLAPHVDAFMLHLFDCRYASNTIDNYLAGLTHFAHWLTESHIDVKTIDEGLLISFQFFPVSALVLPAIKFFKLYKKQ